MSPKESKLTKRSITTVSLFTNLPMSHEQSVIVRQYTNRSVNRMSIDNYCLQYETSRLIIDWVHSSTTFIPRRLSTSGCLLGLHLSPTICQPLLWDVVWTVRQTIPGGSHSLRPVGVFSKHRRGWSRSHCICITFTTSALGSAKCWRYSLPASLPV